MLLRNHRNNGFFGSVKLILVIISSRVAAPLVRLEAYHKIKRQKYAINFVNEGAVEVRLPRVSTLEILLGRGDLVRRNVQFQTRPHSEVLLRKMIYELYESGYISRDLAIIDIGSWISDNSIVWAHFLSGATKVIAIDPSRANLEYAQELARINQVENIKFVEAVCADRSGIKLYYDGSTNHTEFKISGGRYSLVSSTIDEIMAEDRSPVGFLHVDVEGFELPVLKGAWTTINRDFPVISFEQHISKENIFEIADLLKGIDYRVFMINEVLPGCSLDCRNFLAFPAIKGMPQVPAFDQQGGRELGIYSAVVGDVLIEV